MAAKRMLSLLSRRTYEKLQLDEEDNLSSRESIEDVSTSKGRRPSWLTLVILTTVLNIGVLSLNVALLERNKTPTSAARNQVLRDTSYYSPMFDRLDIPLRTQKVNATLANEGNWIWRRPPSPEVDAAWERVALQGYHTVTTKDIIALGRDPEMTIRAPLDWGLGPDAHVVQLDMSHLIHCLNVVRKAMYPDYYPMRKVMVDSHPQHCLHILLQNLMCDASVDLITHTWMETQHNPFPDMSINKKCRDFEAVLGWHEENMVPVERMIPKPAGAKELRLTPKLKELLEAHEGDDD